VALQPLTGIVFFHQRVKAEAAEEFTAEQKDIIERSYAGISSIFGAEGKTIAMMFRMGYADAPTATSLKMPPVIVSR
jgi:hypothetical protein